MITVDKFLQCVRENADRVTHYQSGGDGSGGGCDCIGLIIGALRLAGEQWNGTHGSNWAARNAIQEPWPYRITGESELQPGMIVFKARMPGESGYDLPDSYKNSDNLADYYHVGVVMRVDPLTILHCTKNLAQGIDGITEDHSLGKWEFYGLLKQVIFPGQEGMDEILYYARVISANGYPVRLRPEPNTDKTEICKVGINTVIPVLEERPDGWDKVEYGGIIGYMMSEFLVPLGETQEPEKRPEQTPGTSGGSDLGDNMTVSRTMLEDAYYNIRNAESAIKSMLGW